MVAIGVVPPIRCLGRRQLGDGLTFLAALEICVLSQLADYLAVVLRVGLVDFEVGSRDRRGLGRFRFEPVGGRFRFEPVGGRFRFEPVGGIVLDRAQHALLHRFHLVEDLVEESFGGLTVPRYLDGIGGDSPSGHRGDRQTNPELACCCSDSC